MRPTSSTHPGEPLASDRKRETRYFTFQGRTTAVPNARQRNSKYWSREDWYGFEVACTNALGRMYERDARQGLLDCDELSRRLDRVAAIRRATLAARNTTRARAARARALRVELVRVPRSRCRCAGRPARRSGASSRTAGADPGDADPAESRSPDLSAGRIALSRRRDNLGLRRAKAGVLA